MSRHKVLRWASVFWDVNFRVLKLRVGWKLSDPWCNLNGPLLGMNCQELCVKESVEVSSEQQASIVFVSWALREAVQVSCLQDLGRLRAGKRAVLAKALHHRETEFALANAAAGHSDSVSSKDDS